LAQSFAELSPGLQQFYVINLDGAKTVETRFRRIKKFRPKIIAGKGATER